ncbi:asparagine--tRNA ligase, cytoplasmic 2-like isoform X2 [Vigna angularis]|uniref:asparagine--tRNA ligase, cytoplasmic 2 isoform X2 n=1 Tax=Phaseolus angularis TaxID=3914 RepID=UPI0008099DEE|nr:asparagine--tRNA ligase, cytoplasmic 2 isoform X2 [Vigna angularis]XP_052723938.1 asparagine--tRNA ligase, cytoplasmic 2-like isoform X2 [Vigna angularis]
MPTTTNQQTSPAPLHLESSHDVPPLQYSNRVQIKTLLDRSNSVVGQRVTVGGWIKSAKEVEKAVVSSSSSSMASNVAVKNYKGKDVSCVEILQSKIPLIRSILDVFGGSGYVQRKKRESVVTEPNHATLLPPKASIVYLLLTDGSCVQSLQVVVDSSLASPSRVMATGTCLLVEGQLERTSEGKHDIELKAEKILHIGTVDFDKYPLSKKRIPLDTLRDYSHFRPRTTTVATLMRIRSALSFATHTFFKKHEFIDVQVPTITTTDSEGFSNMFKVTTLDQNQKAEKKEKLETIYENEGVSLEHVKAAVKEKSNIVAHLQRTESNREALAAAVQDLKKTNDLASQLEAREKRKLGTSFKDDKVDSSNDFFPFQTYLTVSGRLHLESYACALGNVYSFGPRFLVDRTDSAKLAAEMWMVEVEMAFSELKDSMNCASDFFKYLCNWVLENCSQEMEFVRKRIDTTCSNRLKQIITGSPKKLTYHEAIEALRKTEDKKYETNFESGFVLTSEHISSLAEDIFKNPIIIYNYPKEAKPFYVRQNDDGTVAAFDLIVPKLGTVISGSQNEERLNMISSRIDELGLEREKYEWYLDLRRNGTVINSGFTLRFDLMVLFATGLANVRDVIPFPRSYGKANN